MDGHCARKKVAQVQNKCMCKNWISLDFLHRLVKRCIDVQIPNLVGLHFWGAPWISSPVSIEVELENITTQTTFCCGFAMPSNSQCTDPIQRSPSSAYIWGGGHDCWIEWPDIVVPYIKAGKFGACGSLGH